MNTSLKNKSVKKYYYKTDPMFNFSFSIKFKNRYGFLTLLDYKQKDTSTQTAVLMSYD